MHKGVIYASQGYILQGPIYMRRHKSSTRFWGHHGSTGVYIYVLQGSLQGGVSGIYGSRQGIYMVRQVILGGILEWGVSKLTGLGVILGRVGSCRVIYIWGPHALYTGV